MTTDPTTRVLNDVEAERARQVEKGWTHEHDNRHNVNHLVTLGARRIHKVDPQAREGYYSRRRLVEATALLVAAIERLDAAAAEEGGERF